MGEHLLNSALANGCVYVIFYSLLFLFTVINTCLRLVSKFKNKHLENVSWLGPRLVFRIGNYLTILFGIFCGSFSLAYYNRNGETEWSFFLAYRMLEMANTYGILYTFFFTITTVFVFFVFFF